jgi:hypothetical protein
MKSESRGRKIVLVPEPLFNYRVSDSGMLQSGSLYRGASRARAGLQHGSERWLRGLIESVHEAALGPEIRRHGL